MSTVAIYNGFGGYETDSETGKAGIELRHGGVAFFFPFQEVAYIPDFVMREVDHNASTADQDEESVLTYKTFTLSGQRIAEELLETQVPYKNSDKGLIVLDSRSSKTKSAYRKVFSGVTELGQRLSVEVQEIVPSPEEIHIAEQKAKVYKHQVVQNYFQSKRERMAGGHGQIFPTGLIQTFMDELGIKDIDDVTRQTGQNDMFQKFMEFITNNRNQAPPEPVLEQSKPEQPKRAPKQTAAPDPVSNLI